VTLFKSANQLKPVHITEPVSLQQIDRTYVRFQGRKLSYFSGCDYFRLSSDPRLIEALEEGVKKYGLNVAASRLTSGNHVLYQRLEHSLRTFFTAGAALLVPTGYLTNLILAQALAGNFSHALIDEEAHPSLADAAQLLECPVVRFKHRDVGEVDRCARRCGSGARLLLLTDGLFSRDGSVAPLAEYFRVLPKDAWLLVDDAHGAGVLGSSGKGSLEQAGLSRDRIIQTITLSKAFGAYGGAILGSISLRQNILSRSRMFIGSTPLPLPLANVALRGVRVLKSEGAVLRKRLEANTAYLRNGLRLSGLSLEQKPGPMITIVPNGPRHGAQLKRELLRANIYPPYVQYPGGAENGCFRFAISSEHERSQLDRLTAVLKSK
jgi:7-keto-8-aminopelargonate synthetase-like enzyme